MNIPPVYMGKTVIMLGFYPHFLLSPGAAAAITLGKGFLVLRKAGHLCVATQNQSYSDYTGKEKTMEVRADVLKPG